MRPKYSFIPSAYLKVVALTSNDGTSHEHLLKEIKNRINKKSEERSFSEIFRDLKKSRIMADYTDKQFDETESAECMQKAESLLYKLKHNFGDL